MNWLFIIFLKDKAVLDFFFFPLITTGSWITCLHEENKAERAAYSPLLWETCKRITQGSQDTSQNFKSQCH